MAMGYVLMHKDRRVLEFSLDGDGVLVEMGEIFDVDRLPFGEKYRGLGKPVFVQFSDWLEKRGLSDSRVDLDEVKSGFGVSGLMEITEMVYGLRLSDCYWFCPVDAGVDWGTLNFYDNGFGNVVDFDGPYDYGVGEVRLSPDLTVDGALRKKWVVGDDGVRLLLKEGREPLLMEPFNEVVASGVSGLLGVSHVPYWLAWTALKNRPLSVCECFTNKDVELVPAGWVLDMELKGGRDGYARFVDVCSKKGLDVGRDLQWMMVLDFVMGNADRHVNNFGVLRDADSLVWLGFAPLYDNGASLGTVGSPLEVDTPCRWLPKSNLGNLFRLSLVRWDSVWNEKILDDFDAVLGLNGRLSVDVRDKMLSVVRSRLDVLSRL